MSARNRPSDGPWSIDGFNEIVAGQPDYGSMIIASDGETIVAQCVAEHNLNLIRSAPELYDGCNALLGLLQLLLGRDDLPAEVREVMQTSHRVEDAEAAVAKANGEQVHSDPLPKEVGR